MTQVRVDVRRDGRPWIEEELQRRLRLAPELTKSVAGIFASEIQRFVVLGLLLETIGIDRVIRFGNLEDWKAAIADLERQQAQS